MNTKFDFSGKKILITGGSKGIGKAIAEAFLEARAQVSVLARRPETLLDLQSRFPTLTPYAVDVTQEKPLQKAIEQSAFSMGGIDVLVNNAGGAIQFGDFWSLSTEAWQEAFSLNVLSVVHAVKYAVPFLRSSSTPRILQISSISGVEPGFFNPHYTTTKASILNLNKYLSNLLAKEKILVNAVCPGSVATEGWEESLVTISKEKGVDVATLKTSFRSAEEQKTPLGRMGEGSDVAPLVLFLASEEASWITGSVFHVNGGKMKGMC